MLQRASSSTDAQRRGRARFEHPHRCARLACRAGRRLHPAVVDHAREYVDGHVHTNGIENFWSLLKRGLKSTYISVEPFHLFRYLDERAFTFNERARRDLGRFVLVMMQAVGRRVTWNELTGKAAEAKGQAAG